MADYFRTVYSPDGTITTVPFTAEEQAEREQQELEFGWNFFREERNKKLLESDIYVLPDRWITYTPEKQIAISEYRQALRDLPDSVTDPFNVSWPQFPEL